MHVKCFDCQTLLPSESASSKEEAPCPECGSIRKDITLSFEDAMPMHDAIRGKVKESNKPSRDNPRIDFFSGDNLRKKDNKWMKKSRTIDKNNNLYKETVIDPETNEIVHHCEELLSNHQGHGKAKAKKDEQKSETAAPNSENSR